MRVAVAFDHRGVKLREGCCEAIEAAGHDVVDLGIDTDAVRIDYPDKALELGMAIRRGEAERGVLVCGSGVGASIAASKIPGIRAAICHDTYSAHQGVEHDDMNVLCLGSEIVGAELARELVHTFLGARFIGGGALRRPPREGGRARKDVPMAESHDSTELSDAGVSVWIDSLSREMLDSGELAAADGGRRRRRGHVESDDLPEGARRGRPATTSSWGGRGADDDPVEIFFALAHGGHPRRLRPDAAGLGANERHRRLRLARGRPDARLRPRARRSTRRCGSRGASTGRTST